MLADHWQSILTTGVLGTLSGVVLGFATVGHAFDFYKQHKPRTVSVQSSRYAYATAASPIVEEMATSVGNMQKADCRGCVGTGAYVPVSYTYYHDEIPTRAKTRMAIDNQDSLDTVGEPIEDQPVPDADRQAADAQSQSATLPVGGDIYPSHSVSMTANGD